MKAFYSGVPDNTRYIPVRDLHILKIKDYEVIVNPDIGGWAAVDEKEKEQLLGTDIIFDKEFGEKAYQAGLAKRNGRMVFEKEKVHLSPGVIYFFEFCLSNACNLNCVYCSNDTCTDTIQQPDIEIGRKWIDRIVEYALKNPMPKITLEFTGGEPLVNAEFIFQVCTYAQERFKELDSELCIVFASNMTVLGSKQLELLKKFKVSVQVSLDGPKHIHDKQRPFPNGRGSFDTVMKNLKTLEEEGIKVQCLASVITALSVEHLPEIVQFIINTGRVQMTLQPMQAVGRGSRISKLAVDPQVYVDKLFEALDTVILPYWKEHKLKFHVRHLGILFMYLLEPWRNYMCQRSPCGNSSTIISTDAFGNVYGCNHAPFNEETLLGNIMINSYEECQRNKNAIKFRERSYNKIELCSKCLFRSFCQAGCPKTALSLHDTIMAPGDLCAFNKALFMKGMEKLIEKAYPSELVYDLASSYSNWR